MDTTKQKSKPCAYPHLVDQRWQEELEEELSKPYMFQVAQFVAEERLADKPIYPPKGLVFNAFDQTPFDEVKVVLVGQDPYHGPGQAEGLCFSVPRGIRMPPSLQNIFKELVEDIGIPYPPHGSLISWAKQGVLLLNATLTVRQSQPKSHFGHGWERFTDAVIDRLCRRQDPLVFVLWGKPAQEKGTRIIGKNSAHGQHTVLIAPHPSPFSAHSGFFGCRHFSQINSLLAAAGKKPIDWRIS